MFEKHRKNNNFNKKNIRKRKVNEPKYKLLKSSWNVQTKLFFERSTLHGVRYTAEEGRPFIEKLLWFCCVSIGAVATMVIIVSLWEKFQTNPTITGLDTDFHNWDVPFPAITFCASIPSNTTYIDDFVREVNVSADIQDDFVAFLDSLTKISYETLPDFKKYINKGYVTDDTDLKEYAFRLMSSCNDIFKGCMWLGADYDCCNGFYPVFSESGFCYSFNSKSYERYPPRETKELPAFDMRFIQETDIKWSLKMIINEENAGLKFPIYIHNSDEVPGIDVQPQHVWKFKVDRISFSVKHTYTTVDTRQLSVKQRKCIFDDEMKLKIDDKYTYSACARQCRMETAKKYCGCIPYFYPEIDGFRHCKIKELVCIIDHLEAIKSVDGCHCELGCLNTVYEVEKLNEHANLDVANWALEAQFVSWPMVRYKREVLFGWVDLLVAFGGIAGLFLGFSLLSGVEIVYYFTIRACCMVNREPEKLAQILREEVVKVKPDYDLSLVPYFIKKPTPSNGIHQLSKSNFEDKDYNNYQGAKPINVKQRKNKKIFRGDKVLPPFGIEFLP